MHGTSNPAKSSSKLHVTCCLLASTCDKSIELALFSAVGAGTCRAQILTKCNANRIMYGNIHVSNYDSETAIQKPTKTVSTCAMHVIPMQFIPSHFDHALHHTFRPVRSVYRCNPFRSTLNTRYITRVDMCAVCTDAIHSVAL